MEIKFQEFDPDAWHADVIIIFWCENETPAKLNHSIDKACPWLAIAPALTDFHGASDEELFVYGHPDLKLPRALLVGLGKKENVTAQEIRDGAARAARAAKRHGLKNALFVSQSLENFNGGQTRLLEEFVYGFGLGEYEFTEFKTNTNEKPKLETLYIASTATEAPEAATRGQTAYQAIYLARDLANLPGNVLYPETFALRASQLAQKHELACTILDENELTQMGAGCIVAVGQGSTHPPRLICLEYTPANHESDNPVALIGKGLTFDSGGLCLKPAANMAQMKCDMSGAAAVLAVICAAAQAKLECRIIALLACAENMPDGRAYRPGDILTSLKGDTVEVVNTDAEGRLVLADALTYVQKKWTPSCIIDIATLTGACAVALGNNLGGLFANDDAFAELILNLGKSCGENYWRLPLWDKYKKSLKSEIADIKHTASREGGAITAALFLENFINPNQKWAHMDIAGVDWNSSTTPQCPEGPTGFGTRALLEIVRGGAW